MPFIKERLRECRKQNSMSTDEIGNAVNVGKTVIIKYENGTISKIDADKIELLAQAVHCDPAYLMGWQDSPTCEDLKANATERNFVEKLRTLNADGQERLLEHLEVMIASQKFNK